MLAMKITHSRKAYIEDLPGYWEVIRENHFKLEIVPLVEVVAEFIHKNIKKLGFLGRSGWSGGSPGGGAGGGARMASNLGKPEHRHCPGLSPGSRGCCLSCPPDAVLREEGHEPAREQGAG